MKSRLTFLMLLLLPMLASCGGGNSPSPSTATPAPDAAPAATEPAPAAAPPQAGAPVAGTDYLELPQGAPYAPAGDQVEVAEVFGYVCVHCANFEPLLTAWKQTLPAGVRVTPVPAAFGGFWDTYAQAFYAAEQMGVREKTHQALFDALHVQRSLPPNASPEQIGAFYARFGVDAKAFVAAMQGPAVAASVAQARRFAERSRVESTPTLIIDGKYLVPVDDRGYEHMLRTASYLVAQQHARLK